MKNRLEYHPLPPELADAGQFNRPLSPAAPSAMPEPTPEMRKRMEQDQIRQEARMPYADLFQSGSASAGGLTMPYRLYVPEDMEPGQKYPMVVFLHGGGERGKDNRKQLLANDGACVWVRGQREKDEPRCFVLAMQCPENRAGWLERHLLVLAAALDDLEKKYPVDTDRVCLTGMSMGGGGCWRMNYMFPNRFSAVAACCSACAIRTDGTIDPKAIAEAAEGFRNKPLWLFHAADDFVVTPESSRCLAAAISAQQQGPEQTFFYTEYPAEYGLNHGCWDLAYENRIMRAWLLQQTIAPAVPGPMPEMDNPPPEFQEKMQRDELEKEARKEYLARFEDREKTVPNLKMKYRLFAPEHRDPEKVYPIVVFLHGIGECGSDNTAQILSYEGAVSWVRAQDAGTIEPCFVLAPQCPLPIPGNRWEDEYLELAAEILTELQAEFPLDENRIYLTGLSLGGFGVWNLNRLHPDRYAALVTCCPAAVQGDMFAPVVDEAGIRACAGALREKPLWMFHAEDDGAVPVETTKRMCSLLQEQGKTDFRVTIYPAEEHWNHGCWEPTYRNTEMQQWLMAQRR